MLLDFQYDHPSEIFHGVRFLLLGFDPITKSNVSSKLVNGGGVDVGQYGPICTHLIVHNLIYDDPICVVARNDGKTLVTGLWVEHCLNLGMPVDPASVMYRPLIDFKGIPGAKSLVVCLTGYQRQDRDDIMTMVHLMGANFSKPLVANKVTHLVCYKFEGEKYELAKKTKKINLVNHLWLEDCLRAWELLPEAEYNRSVYELELEAEAKDSEETDISTKSFQPLNPKQELQRNLHDSSASENVSHISTNNDMTFSAGNDRKSDQDLNAPKVIDTPDSTALRDVSCGEVAKSCKKTVDASIANDFPFSARSDRSPHSDASKLISKSYLSRTRETTPIMYSGEMMGKSNTVQTVNAGKSTISHLEISSMTENLMDETDFGLKILNKPVWYHVKQSSLLDEKQNMDIPFGSSKSGKGVLNLDSHVSAVAVEMNRSDKLEPNLLISDTVEVNSNSNNVAPFSSLIAAMSSADGSLPEVSKYNSSSVSKKLPTSSSPIPETVTSEISQYGNLEDALITTSAGSKKVNLASKLDNRDATTGQEHFTGKAQTLSSPQTKISTPKSTKFEIEKSNGASNLKSHADAHSTPPTRKVFTRRSWSKGKNHFNTNLQGSLCSNKILSEEDFAISSTLGEENAGREKLEKASSEGNPITVIDVETYDVSQSRNKDHQNSMEMDDETEAPEEKENESREPVTDEKYEDVQLDIMVYDDKSEDLQTKKATFQVHSHSMTENLKDETDFGLMILKEPVLDHAKQTRLLDEKQNMNISFGSSKSGKGGLNLHAHISAGIVEMNRSGKLEPNLLVSDTVEVNNCFSNNVAPFSSLTAAMSSPNRSVTEVSKYQSSSASTKLSTSSSPAPMTVTSEISQDGNLEDALIHITPSAGSKKVSLASKPDNRDATIGQELCTGEAQTISSPQTKISTPGSKKFGIEKSNGISNFKCHADAHSTPPTMKMFSRGSWSKGKTHFRTNLQGSLCSNKTLSEEDSAMSSTLGEENAGREKLEKASAEVNPSTVIDAETSDVSQSRNKDHQKSMAIDDETEAPEEKENEFREAVTDEKYKDVQPDIMVYDDKSEDLQTKEATFQVHSHRLPSGEDIITEGNKTTCGKRKLSKSANIPKALKSKRRGKREPLSKIKNTAIPFAAPVDEEENEVKGTVNEATCKEVEQSVGEHKSEAYNAALEVESGKTSGEYRNGHKQKKAKCGKRKLGESTHVDHDLKNILLKEKYSDIEKRLVPLSKSTNCKEAVSEEAENDKNEGSVPHLTGEMKRNESTNDFYKSIEVYKQNTPIHTDGQNVSQGKKQVRRLAPIKSSSKTDTETSKSNLERGQVQRSLQHGAACFILSTHKLQMKEFQQVIKRLKGKVCRDSHQWSYRATHLIVADPVRRTEKFFAAAASGSWILKTNYLIDSSQSGKFLAEEPYEWHKSGLSEDGAINLEAPRKWRLHREKTGHGAFHGMNIVIYGECITPSLDTLKRVLKAGEGKILATFPPYTRFLKSRVDFAVVSPGMPHVDIWIQEFLRHEIPCVVADYLVEFVCKPGHTLERHVLYNSHALAEKVLNNLMSRSEASVGTPPSHGGHREQPSVEVMTPPNDSDIQCQVCGSRDREDDSGSSGCGIGMDFDIDSSYGF